MRVLLLEDHEYPVNQVTGRVGAFALRVGGNILRYPSGTMVEVGFDRRMIIGGQETEHRLMDKPGAWIELIARDEADEEQRSLYIELSHSFDYCKALEDRARDAEHEARECRTELERVRDELFALQADILRMTTRLTAREVMQDDRVAIPARTQTEPQAIEKDCQATGADNG